jgi:hypothetical protein
MNDDSRTSPSTLRAILSDIQFWIPTLVLAAGIILLVFIHNS